MLDLLHWLFDCPLIDLLAFRRPFVFHYIITRAVVFSYLHGIHDICFLFFPTLMVIQIRIKCMIRYTFSYCSFADFFASFLRTNLNSTAVLGVALCTTCVDASLHLRPHCHAMTVSSPSCDGGGGRFFSVCCV